MRVFAIAVVAILGAIAAFFAFSTFRQVGVKILPGQSGEILPKGMPQTGLSPWNQQLPPLPPGVFYR